LSRAKGLAAESAAAQWLIARGFEILDRNFTLKGGEIDIIAQKAGAIHFIEVKSGEGFDPIYAITPQKLNRVVKTAEGWLQKRRIDAPYCFDALLVRSGAIELIENVTA
jgi:putative endonuclease